MEIKIISCANSRCGIGRYTHELGSKLAEWGEDVTVFRKDNPKSPHFQVYPYRSFRNLRHYVAPYYLSRAIKDMKPDVWHADYVDAASAFSYLKKRPVKNLFVNVHDAIPFIFPTSPLAFSFYKAQLRFTARHAQKIVVVSETSKQDLMKHAGIESERIEVIYNGINHDFFYSDPIKKQNKVFTIRYVGGLSGPHKNAALLIEMARVLEQEGLDFRLELGGGYPHNTNLPDLVEQYGLKNVHFAGFVADEDLRSFLAEADLFVYPSKYEGFGFPPLEAMASGTATLSSNAGSLEEVLGDGAITCRPDAHLFAHHVKRIMNRPDLKRDLENRAIARASRYRWSKSADQHLQMYERALHQPKLIKVA
jgi:glycosyltransferase involved in cell wall biosynthesis